jgi:hypothetical protein
MHALKCKSAYISLIPALAPCLHTVATQLCVAFARAFLQMHTAAQALNAARHKHQDTRTCVRMQCCYDCEDDAIAPGS